MRGVAAQRLVGYANNANPPYIYDAPDSKCQRARSQLIERAQHAPAAAIQHVGVNHGGVEVGVAEQFLDGASAIGVSECHCGAIGVSAIGVSHWGSHWGQSPF